MRFRTVDAPTARTRSDARSAEHKRERWRLARFLVVAILAVGLGACGTPGPGGTAAHPANSSSAPSAQPAARGQPTHAAHRPPGTWLAASAPVATAVSCADPTFCMTITNGSWSVWTGRHWTPPAPLATGGSLVSVSCPTPLFCMATDVSGNVFQWNGSAWSRPLNLGVRTALSAVSCPTTTFCEAVGFFGDVLRYSGASWSHPAVISTIANSTSANSTSAPTISCASPAFCVVGDGLSQSVFMVAGAWSPARLVDPMGRGVLSVSCPTARFCMAVTKSGDASLWHAGHWSTPVTVSSHRLVSVSCPRAGFCLAVGTGHDVALYSGHWTLTPLPARTEWGGLSAVSCPTVQFCLAVSGGPRDFFFHAP